MLYEKYSNSIVVELIIHYFEMDKMRILFGKFKTNIVHPLLAYLSTPVAKISIANSILFVFYNPTRHYGRATMSPQHSCQNTLPLTDIISNRVEYILFLLIAFLIWLFGISVLIFLSSYKLTRYELKYGPRYFWALWFCGSLAGGLTMQYFMPYESIPIPKVGSDPSISAFISFLTTMKPKKVAFNFIFPIRYWFILLCAVAFVLATDSTNKNLGGLATGVGVALFRRSLIM